MFPQADNSKQRKVLSLSDLGRESSTPPRNCLLDEEEEEKKERKNYTRQLSSRYGGYGTVTLEVTSSSLDHRVASGSQLRQ